MIIGAFLWLAASMFFWPVMMVAVILLWALSEKEEFFWSVVAAAIVGVLVYAKFPEIADGITLGKVAVYAGCYVVLGVIWATIKWVLNAKKVLRTFLMIKNDYLRDNKLPNNFFASNMPAEQMSKEDQKHHHNFIYKIKEALRVRSAAQTALEIRDEVIPQISENKKRYTMWGIYWPFSMLWFFVNDLVRELWNTIYDMVSGRMQAISNAIFKDAL